MLHDPLHYELSDEDLIARYASGDEKAFVELWRRHESRIQAICFRLLLDYHDTVDATQQIALSLVKGAKVGPKSGGRPIGCLGAWVSAVAQKVALSARRDRDRHRRRFAPLLDLDPSYVPQDELELGELALLVHAQVSALPDLDRDLVLACYYHTSGACPKQSQLADAFNCTVRTVNSRLYRVKILLRQRLAPHLHELALGPAISGRLTRVRQDLELLGDGPREAVLATAYHFFDIQAAAEALRLPIKQLAERLRLATRRLEKGTCWWAGLVSQPDLVRTAFFDMLDESP